MSEFFEYIDGDKQALNTLFVEKYRPRTLDELVGSNDIKDKLSDMIHKSDIPHLLLYGPAGTGKTTIARMIVNTLKCDSKIINASDENSVETVRTKIKSFATTIGFTGSKIIILDECDFLSKNFQGILRNLMETYSNNCRFILTCNYVDKIIDPVVSRCQAFSVIPPSKKEIAVHVSKILDKENVLFDNKDVATIVKTHYPDMRKILNDCQRQIKDGKLHIDEQTKISSSIGDKIIDEIIHSKTIDKAFKNIRQIVVDNHISNFSNIYRTLFDKLDIYSNGKQTECILVIAEYLYKDEFVVDSEINFSACIIQLLNEIKRGN